MRLVVNEIVVSQTQRKMDAIYAFQGRAVKRQSAHQTHEGEGERLEISSLPGPGQHAALYLQPTEGVYRRRMVGQQYSAAVKPISIA